ncbi:hypothetical protein SAY86_025864 [Trapa natans]|uniref:Uncharacterized protein n=1 Tax=Trapa natans TaxID=22666 RepID=A0AAN7KGX7_TRANT|nr:hypothetical protein SAY86_025864 [Trapa natans]
MEPGRILLFRGGDGAREMDAGEEEELRPSGCRKQAHNPGVPQVMGSHHADLRQRRNVEPEGGGDGEPLPRTGDVHQRPVAREVPEG